MSPIVNFTDSSGTRHTGVELPASMLKAGVTRRQQESYLIRAGIIPAPEGAPQQSAAVGEAAPNGGVQAQLSPAIEQRLSALERAAAPALPSEQALANWSMQAARVALTHQEMAALADQTVATVEATATAAQSRLSELDSRQTALIETVSASISGSEAAVASAIAELQQQFSAFEADTADAALSTAADIASQQIGPQGYAGSSVTVAMEDPSATDATSWAQRWYGRQELVPGDSALVPTPTALRVFRYTGSQWLEGPAIEPKVVRENVQVSALNTGNAVYPVMASAAAGGGGGSGLADPLTVSIIPKGGSVAVADSSRWQAGGYDTFTSGVIHLEFIPNQGIMGGRHHFVTAAFVLLAGVPDTFQMTEFSVLGGGFNGSPAIFDVTIDGSIGAASAPGGLGIALPAGTANAARLFVTITAADPATRDFTIKGNVIWTPEAATSTQLPNLPVRKQPAWLLVS
jgi:hypothetical protein